MAENSKQPRILVISQVYVPDPASVGQHMADAAEGLAARGYQVRVLTSARGYEDPSVKYPSREERGGVEIIRLPLSSFGKRTILIRLIAQSIFLIQVIAKGLFTPNLSAILVSTSPPLAAIAALIIHRLRRVPIKFWWMDLNPDQMIALGNIKETSFSARIFDWLNRLILTKSSDVIALDRFMADRLTRKKTPEAEMAILPPWPHVDVAPGLPREENPFIQEHGLQEKFVVMYSGNHSIASPLTTLLDAAMKLQDDPDYHFMFIGGGLGKKEIEETIAAYNPPHIVSLPYQPLETLQYSLSSADVHVVTLGNDMVGIIHPCKIYGAMSVGRPILFFGPAPSHISDLLEKYECGWHVEHGDTTAALETLQKIKNTPREQLQEMGKRAQDAIKTRLSKQILLDEFCQVVERGIPSPQA